jgi:citrate synthase
MLIRQSMKPIAPTDSELLSAREAAELLEVKLPTLYAYVSRGQLQSAPGAGGPGRLYRRDEVERLRARHRARAGHGAVAAGALRFGEPALDSAITEITAAGPRYRGHPATELAERGIAFEAVAELLWRGEMAAGPPWVPGAIRLPVSRLSPMVPAGAPPSAALPLVVASLSLRDRARFHAPLEAELLRARALIRHMAASLALGAAPRRLRRALAAKTVAGAVAVALGAAETTAVVRRLDELLVLCADHELNASSFAARVAASTGADLYACVGAALGALSGPLHGGACDRVEAFVAEARDPARAASVVYERTRRGEAIPGFGMPLYPDGDPRAAFILARVRSGAKAVRTALALAGAMQRSKRERPTIDFALVAAAHALALGPGAASAIFAVGRAAGWIAHVLEQRQAGYLMRPRAKYIGP